MHMQIYVRVNTLRLHAKSDPANERQSYEQVNY